MTKTTAQDKEKKIKTYGLIFATISLVLAIAALGCTTIGWTTLNFPYPFPPSTATTTEATVPSTTKSLLSIMKDRRKSVVQLTPTPDAVKYRLVVTLLEVIVLVVHVITLFLLGKDMQAATVTAQLASVLALGAAGTALWYCLCITTCFFAKERHFADVQCPGAHEEKPFAIAACVFMAIQVFTFLWAVAFDEVSEDKEKKESCKHCKEQKKDPGPENIQVLKEGKAVKVMLVSDDAV